MGLLKRISLMLMLISVLLPARVRAQEAGEAKVVVEIPRTQWCQCVRALLNVEGGNIAGCVKSGASEEKLKIFRNRGAGTGNTTVTALLAFAGCSESENENVGSLSFGVQWQGRASSSVTAPSAPPALEPISCEAGNIAAVEATLYRQNRSKLASAAWTCDKPVSRLSNIPASTNLRLVILGKNAAGEALHRGEQNGITIAYKQNTPLGAIPAPPFTPVPAAPANEEVSPTGRVRFNWAGAAGAASYRLQISDNPQFTTTAVDTNMISSFYEAAPDLKSRTYYWRTKAMDAFKSSSPWSPSWSVTVDAEPPVNTTAAQFINNGSTITNSAEVSLAISATKRTGVTGYYISERPEKPDPRKARWVEIPSIASFAAVTSYTLSKGEGPKKIHVWFKDAFGRLSKVRSGSITLDTTVPHAVITSHPSDPTNSTSARFTFTSTKPGSSFLCKLDAEEFSACSGAGAASYQGLSEGSHTFTVKATDRANNVDPEPATFTWSVDTAPPRTTITSKPLSRTNATTASFSFISTKAASAFQCRLDDGPPAVCASPHSYSGLAAGSHTFSVAAVDAVGNIDPEPARYTWTIDTTPFGTVITGRPDASTKATTATFTFTSRIPGAIYQCALDSSTFSYCESPKTYSGLSEKSHTFTVKAIDGMGNEDPSPAEFEWEVRIPPINTSPKGFINRRGAFLTDQMAVTLSISATSEKGVNAYFASESPDTPDPSDPGWITFPAAQEYSQKVKYIMSDTGKKRVYVWFKDIAGNISEERSDTIYLFNSYYVILFFLALQVATII